MKKEQLKVSNKFIGYVLGFSSYLFLQFTSSMLEDIIPPIYLFSVFIAYALVIFVITDFLTFFRVFVLYMVAGYGVFSLWSIYYLLSKAYVSHDVWHKYTLYLFTVTIVASFAYDVYGILKNSNSYTKKFRIFLYEIGLTEHKIDLVSFLEKMKAKGNSLSGNGIFLNVFMYISLPISVFGKTGAYFLGTVAAKEFGVIEYTMAEKAGDIFEDLTHKLTRW